MADQKNRPAAPMQSADKPDPASGPQEYGVERPRDARGTLRRLIHYLRPYHGPLAVVILVATLATGLTLATPYLMGLAVDQLTQGDAGALIVPVLLMLGAFVLSSAAQLVQGLVMVRVAQKAMRALRADLFSHLQTLSLRFFDASAHGELMSRLTIDMEAINQVLTLHAPQLFSSLLTLGGILAIIFILSPWLALGSMLAFPLMLGLVGLVGRKTLEVFRSYQKRLGALNAVLEETYSGQRVVLAFGQEQSVLDRIDQANEAARQTGVRALTMALIVMPMMGILSNLNVAILCGLGGWLAIRGVVSIGTIAAFISYSWRFADPLRQLGNLYNQVQGAMAGAERIFELMDKRPDQTDTPQAVKLHRAAGQVAFEHVTFSYVPGVPVLRDVCLQVRPGERIALVGHTGAGKTTLINLLSRFYYLDEGTISIDGIDIRNVTRDSLRRQLGIVLQQSFLFSESVLENIRYGRLDASDEEAIAAARLAHADGFIRRLPQGYNTVLSERGQSLSEGQRQLVTIARAILADPAILVLDEATSSVDTRTEMVIQQALDELMRHRTSFVIAHRLSTIAKADRVIVIEKGRVVEQGSHAQLLARGGVYHRLYQQQFRGRLREPEAHARQKQN